jgi:hypothetical protein
MSQPRRSAAVIVNPIKVDSHNRFRATVTEALTTRGYHNPDARSSPTPRHPQETPRLGRLRRRDLACVLWGGPAGTARSLVRPRPPWAAVSDPGNLRGLTRRELEILGLLVGGQFKQ